MAADDYLRERVEAMLERWRPRVIPGRESHIDAAVSDITALAAKVKAGLAWYSTPAFGFMGDSGASGQPFGWGTFQAEAWAEPARAHAFRKVGRRTTEAGLSKLCRGLKSNIKTLDSLNEPAILALAHEGMSALQLRTMLEGALKYVERALVAGLTHIPEKQGRQKGKQHEEHEALMVMLAEKSTGLVGECNRSKKRGSFCAFARDVFQAIPLEPPPSDHMVQIACERVKKSSRL